jgi:hypothetical protein
MRFRASPGPHHTIVLNRRVWNQHERVASSVPGFKAISDPGFSADVMRAALLRFELLAQMSHEYTQVFWLFYAVLPPDSPKQSAVRYHLSRVPCQVPQLTPSWISSIWRRVKISHPRRFA